ncbi:unnamed protein product [Phaedon cochleariae]|uniref:BZIP domain-containing protein n=1 Tax=Phaedon cochleariae TaxID=80249 RepID=A0A9N9SHC0_PHACE|nr:unnamed protein product [Phaedon cochleariae]
MQHPLENRIPLSPYGYSHYYPNIHLPFEPQVLDLCTNTKNKFTYDSCSACHSSPTLSSNSTSPEIPQVSSTSKPLRPFKAISKGNLELRHFLYNDESFQEYRNRVLSTVSSKNELCISMRRSQGDASKIEDPEYVAKRKKNNEAAKRSREARKMKEDEIAVRCAYLEQENLQLKIRLAALEMYCSMHV